MAEKIYPDDKHVQEVCKIGQEKVCCRYLTMGPDGWSCEKLSSMRFYLDSRVAANTISAQGDNCAGMDSR